MGKLKITLWTAATLALAQTPPTFRTGTRLVEVDVVVRDKNGAVAGLSKPDFTLLDNGRPQEIAVFSVEGSIPSAPPSSGTAVHVAPAVPLPPGAVSNRVNSQGEARGVDTVFLIDQKNTLQADQAFAIARIVKFIQARGHDRIAIYSFGRDGFHGNQELTADPETLNRAAKNLKAQDPVYRTTDTTGLSDHVAQGFGLALLLERVIDTEHALQEVARHLAKVPGRKNLIWITSSFPLRSRDYDYSPQMEQAARSLNDANIALYAVDARGLLGALSGMTFLPNAESPGSPSGAQRTANRLGAPGPSGLESMELLAGRTGGDRYINTNGIEDSIQTAVEDAELTYTLGFYPSDKLQDGRTHQLSVKVARRGVSVRYRQNYSALNSTVAEERPSLDQLLRDSLDAAQIGLTAQATPDPARPGWFNVRVSVDLHDVKLERDGSRWIGAIDVSIHPEGSNTVRTTTRKIEIPEDQLAASLEKGIEIETAFDTGAPEASGVLRVVVQDGGSPAAGSVRVPLKGN